MSREEQALLDEYEAALEALRRDPGLARELDREEMRDGIERLLSAMGAAGTPAERRRLLRVLRGVVAEMLED